jgi:hypothetical protein
MIGMEDKALYECLKAGKTTWVLSSISEKRSWGVESTRLKRRGRGRYDLELRFVFINIAAALGKMVYIIGD